MWLGIAPQSASGDLVADATGSLSVFKPGDHCVAYRAGNRMALFVVVKVVGRNCSVTTQVVPVLGDRYVFEARIPVSYFDSKETERDTDVRKILDQRNHPNLLFKSDPLTVDEWRRVIFAKESSLVGRIIIRDKEYPIKAEVQVRPRDGKFEVDGIVRSQFKKFGIDPPALAGGLGAKVENWLELHFHFRSDKTLGFKQLIQNKESLWPDSQEQPEEKGQAE